MSNVVDLSAYRIKTRQNFLRRHGARLEHFLGRFIRTHIEFDFERIAQGYQNEAWDYVHFREILAEAFDDAFGDHLYGLLRREVWFEAQLFPRDEIVERCLSAFILGRHNAMVLGR